MKKYKAKVKTLVDQRLLELLTGATVQEGNQWKDLLERGLLETRVVEFDAPEPKRNLQYGMGTSIQLIGISGGDFLNMIEGKKGQKKKMTIAEIRPLVEQQELEKLISSELINKKAVDAVEQRGIVVIDEIDKICVPSGAYRDGADASDEGVQVKKKIQIF